jgi:hypothetical protein
MLVAAVGAACLLWAPAFVAPRQATQAPRASRTLMRADASGLAPGGPLVVYTEALIEAARQLTAAKPREKGRVEIAGAGARAPGPPPQGGAPRA